MHTRRCRRAVAAGSDRRDERSPPHPGSERHGRRRRLERRAQAVGVCNDDHRRSGHSPGEGDAARRRRRDRRSRLGEKVDPAMPRGPRLWSGCEIPDQDERVDRRQPHFIGRVRRPRTCDRLEAEHRVRRWLHRRNRLCARAHGSSRVGRHNGKSQHEQQHSGEGRTGEAIHGTHPGHPPSRTGGTVPALWTVSRRCHAVEASTSAPRQPA